MPWKWDSVVDVGKCSSQRGPGKNFPEFFEKSIDKQKIDAILNSAVRFWSDVIRRRDWGRASRCTAVNAVSPATIPIQDR